MFGYWKAVPESVGMAWGCRAVIEKRRDHTAGPAYRLPGGRTGRAHTLRPATYNIQLVWDRQSWRPEDDGTGSPEDMIASQAKSALSRKLNAGPLEQALRMFELLLEQGHLAMDSRESRTFVAQGITFAGSCNASSGYIYICAWEA
jgi:hypothetical protein